MFSLKHSAIDSKPIRNAGELVASLAAHLATRGLAPTVSPGLVTVTIGGRPVRVVVSEDDFPVPARDWSAVWRKERRNPEG